MVVNGKNWLGNDLPPAMLGWRRPWSAGNTPRDKAIRNANEPWLTKPDSSAQVRSGHGRPNRLQMLPESGFFDTSSFMFHFKESALTDSRRSPSPSWSGELAV